MNMMTKEIKQFMAENGRKGAKRLAEKYGKDYWKKIRKGQKPSTDKVDEKPKEP